jgi:hypothetical protein
MIDATPLLLSDPSPALRSRVLTELLDVDPADPELIDATRQRDRDDHDPTVGADGSWRSLAWSLCVLAYQGFTADDPRVAALAEQVFAEQQPDGSFPLDQFRRGRRPSVYSMAPLQVALPLRGLAMAGYATDPRAERAYQWLLDVQLDDGAWPVGESHGQPGYIAGYRKLPGSRGCRATTQGAIACLVQHPELATSDHVRRPLDLLLQRETRDMWSLGTDVARLTGREQPHGFFTFYADFDLAMIVNLASRAGASLDDPRVAELVAFLIERRGPYGLWEHPKHPELSRWLTFDLSLSLRRLEAGDWTGLAPRVPFRAYPKRPARH